MFSFPSSFLIDQIFRWYCLQSHLILPLVSLSNLNEIVVFVAVAFHSDSSLRNPRYCWHFWQFWTYWRTYGVDFAYSILRPQRGSGTQDGVFTNGMCTAEQNLWCFFVRFDPPSHLSRFPFDFDLWLLLVFRSDQFHDYIFGKLLVKNVLSTNSWPSLWLDPTLHNIFQR